MSTDTTIRRDALATTLHDEPYAELRDRRLAARLAAEDVAEEAGLDPFERVSCRLHRRWLHQCVSSPAHVVAFTGHRWCRTCAAPAGVAVDEWLGDVRVTCTRCGATPRGRATRQLVRACMASLAAAQDV
jgi:hypothetical protein